MKSVFVISVGIPIAKFHKLTAIIEKKIEPFPFFSWLRQAGQHPPDDRIPEAAGERGAHQQEPTRSLGLT